MKKVKAKMCVLLMAAAAPGLFALSCSGTVGREFRDAAVAGAASAVEAQAFDLLARVFPIGLLDTE